MRENATFCWKLGMVSYIYKRLDTATLILYMVVVNYMPADVLLTIYRLMNC